MTYRIDKIDQEGCLVDSNIAFNLEKALDIAQQDFEEGYKVRLWKELPLRIVLGIAVGLREWD